MTNHSTLQLLAPVSGVIIPLDQVPDPVFAQKMVGEGISIDPTSEHLLAPCNGKIIQIHPAKHAVTIESDEGVEVLMHIGLDTVMLKGSGFIPLVKEGDTVQQGDPLIDFDADKIALAARSLMTEIIITNGDAVSRYQFSSGLVEAGKDVLLTLSLGGQAPNAADGDNDVGAEAQSVWVYVPNPTGIHARPAATLASQAKGYQARIKIERDGQSVDAKSVVAIMGLNVKLGEQVRFLAKGRDSNAAVKALVQAVKDGLGEDVSSIDAPQSTPVVKEEISLLARESDDPDVMIGIAASPGIAIGQAYQLSHEEITFDDDATDPDGEREALTMAIDTSRQDLQNLHDQLKADGNSENAEIFLAHQELLEDPSIFQQAKKSIKEGKSAARGWYNAIADQIKVLEAVDSDVIAGRVADLKDVRLRVLKHILGITDEDTQLPENTIIIAEDLTPSDTASLDRSKVIGFVTTLGGATSHAAILARSMDLPALAGVSTDVLELANGHPLILDGEAGTLNTAANEALIETLRSKQIEQQQRQKDAKASAHDPAVTSDGHTIEIVANIGNASDARSAMEYGAEGVGLLRSEFLYLDQAVEPTEDQQAQVYTEIADALGSEKPLIVRTLDVGGDKPLPYLPMPAEENPFLGERGIRIGINRPSILRRQVRAILRAQGHAKIKIMFPMIATLPELIAAKKVVLEEAADLGVTGVEIGIMVEVPSTAALSSHFAQEADFFSIGTNDLTQYTLAMDRGHPKLGWQVDALDPAVLQLIYMTVQGAQEHGKWVGVCGGAASDPLAVPVLIGLGVTELSCSVPAIPLVKQQIRKLSLSDCQALAKQVLEQPDAESVRALLSNQ
ncbi:phosphoenolpyruvate--protein phosphotransferase [Echinimonas agarilytica]|uniref:phosphoenolpyruvate--protein phosphotransferase n=1 Tax=Echinimonas agarilytica TaxID=1215918 RepID=A0AA41W4Y0_9GAMM|nr:phosphoenolpyruvate--protein phosphotransferase [Echinimonas agarilytica]MCM2678542.1 phosphoenolpyruvate--protein phosphotransferase [Echinimonas agarilytica]